MDVNYQTYLPFIDIKDGLNRLRDNKTLYGKLLKSFLANTYMDMAAAAAAAGDFAAAAAHAHAIKGSSANLSLTRVYQDSLALEQCFKAGGGGYQILFDTLKTSTAETFALINKLLTELQ